MKDKHDKVTLTFPEMEGDYVWTEAECRVARDQAGHELHFHQTIVAFEELMHKHGLHALLEHMSDNGQDAFWAAVDGFAVDGGYE